MLYNCGCGRNPAATETRGVAMRKIYTGKTNDAVMYAVEVDGKLVALTAADLEYEVADVAVYYDSGVYPMTEDEATNAILTRAEASL